MRDVIAPLNPVLRGWGNCSRTGNAAHKVNQVAPYACRRLKARLRQLAVLAALVVAGPAFAAAPAPKTTKKKGAPPAAQVAPELQPPAATAPAPSPEPPPPPPAAVVPGPAAAAPPPPPRRKPTVAVFDVDVTVPNERLDAAAFSELLVSALDSTQAFIVVSAKEIGTMLGLERQRQLMGCSEDTSCMTELASALGTDFVMVASIGKVGDGYLVSTKLIDGQRNRVTARATVQAPSPNALLEAVWRSTQQTLDGYGGSLPSPEAEKWAARPKPTPPSAVVAAETTPSFFGVAAAAIFGYQPLSEAGLRGSIGAQVDLTFRRGLLDLALGVVVARSAGARFTVAVGRSFFSPRLRADVGVRGTAFPGLGSYGVYGGGLTAGAELALSGSFALCTRGAVEAYGVPGGWTLAMLGAVGVAARF